MGFLLIRHGTADRERMPGARGFADSLAPLSELGRLQMDIIAGDFRLREAGPIISSSYTRCLESAALLNRHLNRPLFVEPDLHEWLPHTDPRVVPDEGLIARANEGLRRELEHGGPTEDGPWESLAGVRQRALAVLSRYDALGTCIVVTHAVVISALLGTGRAVRNAEIIEFSLPTDAGGVLPRDGTGEQGQLLGR